MAAEHPKNYRSDPSRRPAGRERPGRRSRGCAETAVVSAGAVDVRATDPGPDAGPGIVGPQVIKIAGELPAESQPTPPNSQKLPDASVNVAALERAPGMLFGEGLPAFDTLQAGRQRSVRPSRPMRRCR